MQRVKGPVAWCALTVETGSRDELAAEHGLAHFTEHMLFKGTEKRRAHHINSRLERPGGELNAYTTKEETAVHATVLRADLAKAAELISDVVFRSVFPVREVLKEREVVVDEIYSYQDSPSELIYDEFEDLLFTGSSLGHNILGTRKSVSKFDDSSLRGFTGRTYNTDRMVFSVAGNITEKTFAALCERYFGAFPARSRQWERTVPAPVSHFDLSPSRRTHQAHCVLGSRAYSASDPHRTALALLINILGGPAANSRLNEMLREKNGLTYTAEASYTPFSDCGMATIYFGTEHEKVARCREIISRILGELCTRELSTSQLSAAKKQFIGQFSIAQQSHESSMLAAGKSLLLYGEVDPPAVVCRKIAALTAPQLLEAANETLAEMSVLTYQ